MQTLYTLAFFFCSSISLLAQTNYVNNTANSVNPGLRNTLVGPSAGQSTANGTDNVFLGANAGSNNTDGNNNTFIGANAGLSNTDYNNNTFVGYSAGNQNTIGYYNTFMGASAGYFSSSGNQNTYIGMNAGFGNSSGTNNTYLGFNSGQLSNTGTQNTFVGSHAGLQTQGANNTFVGYLAGSNNTSGSNNVLIGPSSGTVIITGDDNIMLGVNSQPTNGNIHNAIAIGSNAKVALDNAIVLGDPANISIAVGIGTDSPQFPLDVRGIINVRNNGTIKFSHLSNIVYQGATNQFLTVNEQGETVLAKHRLRIDHVNQWSDKVFSPGYLLRPLTEIASYIQQNGHLPGVPSAEEVVKEGVDLLKMNALLLEKVEELTLYSIQQQRRIDQLEKTDQVNHQLQIELVELKGLVKQLLDKK